MKQSIPQLVFLHLQLSWCLPNLTDFAHTISPSVNPCIVILTSITRGIRISSESLDLYRNIRIKLERHKNTPEHKRSRSLEEMIT